MWNIENMKKTYQVVWQILLFHANYYVSCIIHCEIYLKITIKTFINIIDSGDPAITITGNKTH
jgi:hypothetical protein